MEPKTIAVNTFIAALGGIFAAVFIGFGIIVWNGNSESKNEITKIKEESIKKINEETIPALKAEAEKHEANAKSFNQEVATKLAQLSFEIDALKKVKVEAAEDLPAPYRPSATAPQAFQPPKALVVPPQPKIQEFLNERDQILETLEQHKR